MAPANKDQTRKIYALLPKLNCSLCGYGNCGQFAVAVVERKVSPFSCRQNPWVGYNISEIIGLRVPVFRYQQRFYQPIFTPKPGSITSLKSLGAEVSELSKRIEGILDRIDNLGRKKGKIFKTSR